MIHVVRDFLHVMNAKVQSLLEKELLCLEEVILW
jgi:hypothetical protein